MSRHVSLPATMTIEQLAKWIVENQIDKINHTEKFKLTEDEIREQEHKSSAASRSIDRLNAVKDEFMNFLKEGTPTALKSGKVEYEPVAVTIPPSKGLKSLKANREHADSLIEAGSREEITEIYMIPWPEQSLVIGVDIVGLEWPQYTRVMTKDEINAHKPLLKVSEGGKGKGGKKKEKEEKQSKQEDFLGGLN